MTEPIKKACNQCRLENNKGICDKLDCLNYPEPNKKVTTCPKCHCCNPKSDHVCPEWATTPHHDKQPLKIEDHHNLPSVQIGNFSIKRGMQDSSKVWIGTEEGEGGDFPISLLEPVIAEFFNKYF